MKKLLSVLATVGVVASSSTSVVACGTKKEDGKSKPEEPKKDITQVVQDFEQDVTKIWTQHYEKEVASYLIGVESMEEGNEFLNKYNIQKFSKPENKDKLTIQNKQQLTNDVERLFKVKLLEEKLNNLKKINKYKIILDEVDSVFEHVELLFNDSFEINSGEIVSGAYIGNVVVDYKVVIQYKGLVDVEKFKQSGTLKYTSTESESFKTVGDAMYKNIAKDMFTLQETQKYVNLKWKDIKGTSDDSDAYLSSNAQLKKYYNENESFHNSLLKIINEKYFRQEFPSMDISYDKKSIYKTDDFSQVNKDYLVINNLYRNNANIVNLDLANSEEKSKSDKILQGDKDVFQEVLMKDQFNSFNWSRIRNSYKVVQDTFLNKFLSEAEVSEYQKTDSYKLAIAMGYIDFVGPSIKIGAGESTYNHQMPDFKLAISYSMNGVTDENYKSLVDFSLKLFEVYKNVYKPMEDTNNWINEVSYFKFLLANKREVWKEFRDKVSASKQEDVDFYLQNFTDYYYKNIRSSLDNIKVSEKVLFDTKIVFDISLNKNKSNSGAFFTGLHHSFYFTLNNNMENDRYLEYYDFMTLNLFGIIKIKMNFNNKTFISSRIIHFF